MTRILLFRASTKPSDTRWPAAAQDFFGASKAHGSRGIPWASTGPRTYQMTSGICAKCHAVSNLSRSLPAGIAAQPRTKSQVHV
jgi:hypothetical protein